MGNMVDSVSLWKRKRFERPCLRSRANDKSLCHFCKKNYRVFLYGNTQGVLIKLSERLKKDFPKLKITGEEESKFRNLTDREWKSLVKKIEDSKVEIVFISLGRPKQEVFSFELSKQQKKPIICVGAAFDFISDVKKQALKWMGDWGLEWLFRLINEPRRLWKRYLIDGLLFFILLINNYIFVKLRAINVKTLKCCFN